MKKPQIISSPILVIDDEPDVLESFRLSLISNGLTSVLTCQDGRDVLDILSGNEDIDLILLDLMMPYVGGQELLEKIISSHPEISVIVITAIDDLQTAVNCMKAGAFDYLVKPVEKLRLLSSVFRAVEIIELGRENMALKKSFLDDTLENPDIFSPIVGRSHSILKLFKYIETIKRSTEPVLITGETGTGKELFAHAIHESSNVTGPFIAVNVAGLDDHAISDTLFGHAKGAFTGADIARDGLIQKARGGTLFLDEIGDMSLASQVKLLRLLQEHEYYPLGSDLPKKCSARIVVATHCNLSTAINDNTFRKDLYYRLRTHQIAIPPLRERMGDLPLLVDCFIQHATTKLGVHKPSYTDDLFAVLKNYDFPGNIRELKTLLFDAVSRSTSGRLAAVKLHDQLVQSVVVPTEANFPADSLFENLSVLPTLKDITQQLIKAAMLRANGNQSLAARFLGLSQPALNRRLSRAKAKMVNETGGDTSSKMRM